MGHAYIGPEEVRRVRMVGRGERTFVLIVLSIWVFKASNCHRRTREERKNGGEY